MKKISEIYREAGIAFSLPIEIKNANGNRTYYEDSDEYRERYEFDSNGKETYFEDSNGLWYKYEYDANGEVTYFETSSDYWYKYEYDANGEVTYFEDSYGTKTGTPKSATCEGKVVEVDGIKYELKAL